MIKFLRGNICPPNTELDTKGAIDSRQLPTKPLLRDPLPSDRPIGSYQVIV